jgi:2-dehydro-3-deoxy-D-arabinonate dehydratase
MSQMLTRHLTDQGPRWALDGRYLAEGFSLGRWLALATEQAAAQLADAALGAAADAPLLAPIEDSQEAWASGVTYLSSRMAREAESQSADVYQKVYGAARPELFFKAAGWRSVGHGQPVRVRADSHWNVPEPELVLLLDAGGRIRGYSAGDDVSSRSIEGENPLYLPQAKVYDGSCAIGPGIILCEAGALVDLPVQLQILRAGREVFAGATRTSQIKRGLDELAGYLFKELSFPQGAFLFTGTGIVPDESFTLQSADLVRIRIGDLVLENPVQ